MLGKHDMVFGIKRDDFWRGVDGIAIEQDGLMQINYQVLAGLELVISFLTIFSWPLFFLWPSFF